MRKKGTLSKLYGFEDYTLVLVQDDFFDGHYHGSGIWNYNDKCTYHYFIQNKPEYHIKYSNSFSPSFSVAPYKNHSELLIPGKTMYIHPSCSISRTLAYTKFARTISPWGADIVVMPKDLEPSMDKGEYAIFIDEDKRLCVLIKILHDPVRIKAKEATPETKLSDWVTTGLNSSICVPDGNFHDIENALFMEHLDLVSIPFSYSYILDVLTGVIPTDKVVFEDTVQQALADETNKPDFMTLVSIRDMLQSSDMDTVGAAIKALATLDYMHYPNSITCVIKHLRGSTKWMYHKVLNSTAVKFMLHQLYGERGGRTWRCGGDYKEECSPEDYALFQELYKEFNHLQDNQLAYLRRISTISFVKEIRGDCAILNSSIKVA